MTDDTALAVVSDDNPAPLRYDSEGNPIYGEWPEEDYETVAYTPEDTEQSPTDEQSLTDTEPTDFEMYGDSEGYEWASTTVETPAEVQAQYDEFRHQAIKQHFDKEILLTGLEKVYSTSDAARFFGRSNQWMYWGLRRAIFTYKDGTPIEPERVGSMGKRRFTLPIIREIALSCYRRGNLTEEELEAVMAKILLAEFGEKAFADTKKKKR